MPRVSTSKRVVCDDTGVEREVRLQSLKNLPPELLQALTPLKLGLVKQTERLLLDLERFVRIGSGDRGGLLERTSEVLEALRLIERNIVNGRASGRSTSTVNTKRSMDSTIPGREAVKRGAKRVNVARHQR